MANTLPGEVVERIFALRKQGHGIRAISRELGISKNTVTRYISNNDGTLCKCGEPAGHQGWCKARYAQSIARQAFHAGRRGIYIEVPKAVAKSRVTESVSEKLIWLGIAPGVFTKPDRNIINQVIIDVGEVCKYIKQDWREDVFQEMITSFLDGRLKQKDIKRSVPTFITFAMRKFCWFNHSELSLSDIFSEDTNSPEFWDRFIQLSEAPEVETDAYQEAKNGAA